MMILNKLDSALGFHQNALRIRAQRQELIAGNIANADTPNFKARDIDFKSAMQEANKQMAGSGLTTAKTSAKHLDGAATNNVNSAESLASRSSALSYKVALMATLLIWIWNVMSLRIMQFVTKPVCK